jgi:hypothetical protein
MLNRLHDRRDPIEKRLSEQIQELIDLLQAAAEHAEDVKQTLHTRLASFGPELDLVDDDIEQLILHLQHIRVLVERVEGDDDGNQGKNGWHIA